MKTDNIDPLLDDLFAEARVETPTHSYQSTKSKLMAGLAVGGVGILTAKIITSSILKSKFFIMSISAVTVLTSAVLVYTVALKPNESISKQVNDAKQIELAQVNTPMGVSLPTNLFVEQPAIIVIEPDDSTIVVEDEESIKDELQDAIEDILEKIDIESIEEEVEEVVAKIGDIDFEISEEVKRDIQVLINDIKDDTILITEIKQMVAEIEASAVEIAEEISSEISHHKNRSVNRYEKDTESKLHRRTFTINNNTSEADLEEFNEMATAAGIDVTYNCKVTSSKIKRLNMKLVLDNDNGSHFSNDYHISDIKRNENFSFNIIWYENEEGQAIKFSNKKNRNECSNSHSNDCDSQ